MAGLTDSVTWKDRFNPDRLWLGYFQIWCDTIEDIGVIGVN